VPQQLWVLIGHAVILLAGLLLAERMFVWWGAAGVALSVMWALRSYAFAMLAVIALALIALAVWRLNRTAP
jgi:membrane protein implicated in regulation of membrane protease activity